MHKPTSAEEYKLISSFDAICKVLLQDRFANRLDRPLAYWALATDRRLPLAFLGRSVRDLLRTSFEELAATPGIGDKKFATLIKLLNRVAKDQLRAAHDGEADSPRKKSAAGRGPARGAFDPAAVSEALWERWRGTVLKHGVGGEKFGRLARSLRSLPTVVWHTPLDAYCNYSIAEIRESKTHGEKRVRTILEVFCSVHDALVHSKPRGHLAVRLLPKFVAQIDGWIDQAADGQPRLTSGDVRQSLVVPLIEQVRLDVGPTVGRLAEGRLGISGETHSVRQQSRRMGVTRARVYQLLEECAKVMAVRWPEGQAKLRGLWSRLEANPRGDGGLETVRTATELFFPNAAELAARAERDGDDD